MSLLMNAMKVAERAQSQGSHRPPPAPRIAVPSPGESANREAVRNAFAVKRTPAVGNRFAWVVGTLTLLAVIGIAIYFWFQLQPRSNLVAPMPERAAGRHPPPPRAEAPMPAPAMVTTVPAATPTTATPNATTPTAEREARAPGANVKPLPGRTPPPPSTPPAPSSPIRVGSSAAPANLAAITGWEAFQAGDLAAARSAYERLLAVEPWNKDALHGLAAIALRENRPADAEATYQRALAADPRDASAQAGLVGLRATRQDGDDPVATESRLKSMLAGQPGSPTLLFALGNLHARQGRWQEAQQAYFQALTGDAGNPDILFNLAVSLDQLRQGGPAADFYRQALAAAEGRPASFDRGAAAERLRELRP